MRQTKKKGIHLKPDVDLINYYRQSDDLEVLGILFNRYVHLVHGVCLKYFKNTQDSQDAAMEIFEKLILSLKKHDIQNFKSWLHATTRNHCLMELRSRKVEGIKTDTDILSLSNMDYSTFSHLNNEMVDMETDLILMKKCIKELPVGQQKCIELFYFERRSYKEVSLLTEFDLKTIKSFIQNGKRNIKNCIEKKREEA